ncbi:50S ribosomal protein L19-2, chloroplastic [Canna indica]|uniref:50S ribosomal protein L19-2, chloroplastic n=1 Tax=Canna indica TaxID=4628 RepID=A0AAQ3Q779_9LILI|nr:50S ribosomal protein L19-2, chloroplastic [Canna indica]
MITSHNGIFKPCFPGSKSFLRRMTTIGHSEVSSTQESTVSSPEIEHPQRIKFKRLDKTAKHIMNILDKEEVDKTCAEKQIPDIKPGYIIQMKVEVPENKRRTSSIKGIVIARRNAGLNTTFRLRRMVAGVGVENVFHLYSPNIKEVKVLDKKKVRRAKLYYLRDRMNPLKK